MQGGEGHKSSSQLLIAAHYTLLHCSQPLVHLEGAKENMRWFETCNMTGIYNKSINTVNNIWDIHDTIVQAM